VNLETSNQPSSEKSIVDDGFASPAREREGLEQIFAKRARDHQAHSREYAETVKELNDRRLELVDQINSLMFERQSAKEMDGASANENQPSTGPDQQSSLIADVRADITAGSMHSTIQKVSVQIPAQIDQISALNTELERTKLNLKLVESSPPEIWERPSWDMESQQVTASHIAAEEQRCRDLELEIQRAQEREMHERVHRQVMRLLLREVLDTIVTETASEVSFSHSWAELTASSLLVSAATSASASEEERGLLRGILGEFQAARPLRPEAHTHSLRLTSSSALPSPHSATRVSDADKDATAAARQRQRADPAGPGDVSAPAHTVGPRGAWGVDGRRVVPPAPWLLHLLTPAQI
jgi:hypothetical protein